jgi:hypothetical protein
MIVDSPIRAPYMVIDDFMPASTAQAMRDAAEAHLGNPYRHTPDTHTDWDYWHVPGLYTYLRTRPGKVLGASLADAFATCLCDWSTSTLGLSTVTASYLSLYVDGCRQGQHNDSGNGRFAFVYSLTKDHRMSTGGETLIWREDDYFATRLHRPGAGETFFTAIEPKFNRLVIFDDRMPHAVQLVEGNMDPLEGRLVIHGHLKEGGPVIVGPLPVADVLAAASRVARSLEAELGQALAIYHGPAIVRFTVGVDGAGDPPPHKRHRVKRLRGDGPAVRDVLDGLIARLTEHRFANCLEPTTVMLPFAFG